MTRDELMAEQFGHGTTSERTSQPLAEWTAADQVQHIADALNVSHGRAARLLTDARGETRPPVQRRQPTRAKIAGIIDDLPPDSRRRDIVVRAKGATLEELLSERW